MHNGGVIDRVADQLPPAAFSFVMAAGIVSVSLMMHDLLVLSRILMVLAILGYLVLIGLTLRQLLHHRSRVRGNVSAPPSRFGYATFVAASGVLGTRLVLLGVPVIPLVQLLVAISAAVVIGQWIVRATRRDVAPWWRVVDGSWFLAAVACHSIGVLAASIAAVRPAAAVGLVVVALTAWVAGIVAYGIVLRGVLTRAGRRQIGAKDLTAPYWITMGACAITVLDSVKLAVLPTDVVPPAVHQVVSWVGVGFWVLATLLIPVILAAGWWRHIRHRIPLDSPTTLWSIVFPLGMYDVASTLTATTHQFWLARVIGEVGVWIALAAWLVTALLLTSRIVGLVRERPGWG